LGKATDKGRRKEPEEQKSKVKQEESSLREKPEPDWPRRLADWTNPEGARKAHSLVDKVTCGSIRSFVFGVGLFFFVGSDFATAR
jgi:hypothetical protein